jgi:hypothetical protein
MRLLPTAPGPSIQVFLDTRHRLAREHLDPEKIRALAGRGEAWGDSKSRQMLDHAIHVTFDLG